MQEYTIQEIQKMFESSEMSSEKLVGMYLQRIEELDKKTNSIIELNPDAIEIARTLDAERREKGPRGPMHGIPVVIKDNIDTSDKMMTTAGSLALEGNIAKNDSHVAKMLRDAGAVILAKANLSEWANFRGQKSSSGWSSRGGQTNNAYALDRNPCGSSSGSAVAVAANYCSVSVGTETDGSVICPAQTNGVVGIKPSIGLIGRTGIVPISHTQDTAGPMGRTVTDAAILLGAMVGKDQNDPVTENTDRESINYTDYLDVNGLRGARLAYSKKHLEGNPKANKLFEKAIVDVKRLGAEVIEVDDFPTVEGLGPAEFNVLLFEYKEDLNKYLHGLDENVKVHSMDEVIKFNEDNKDRVLPHFGHEHFVNSVAKGDLMSEEYLKAMKLYQEYRDKLNEFFKEHNLDAMLGPSGGPAWLTDHINGDSFSGSPGTSGIAAVSGFSSITVPAGYVSGLPVGVSFIGKRFGEETIVKLAYSYEQGTLHRQAPQFAESLST